MQRKRVDLIEPMRREVISDHGIRPNDERWSRMPDSSRTTEAPRRKNCAASAGMLRLKNASPTQPAICERSPGRVVQKYEAPTMRPARRSNPANFVREVWHFIAPVCFLLRTDRTYSAMTKLDGAAATPPSKAAVVISSSVPQRRAWFARLFQRRLSLLLRLLSSRLRRPVLRARATRLWLCRVPRR